MLRNPLGHFRVERLAGGDIHELPGRTFRPGLRHAALARARPAQKQNDFSRLAGHVLSIALPRRGGCLKVSPATGSQKLGSKGNPEVDDDP